MIYRREFLKRAVSGSLAHLLSRRLPAARIAPPEEPLLTYAVKYLRGIRAPGLVFATHSRSGNQVHSLGYSNLEAKKKMQSDALLWIGSLCKSFAAICILQLVDEGKLDLNRPVLDMVPTLRIRQPFGPITSHHLLTHTSGLPSWLRLTSADPAEFAVQAYAPGQRFNYCNLGYDILGLLIEHLDEVAWPEAVRQRVFKPLGMASAHGIIDAATFAAMPTGYQELYRDRPTTFLDPVTPVSPLSFSLAAGSCATTSQDMLLYMEALARGGNARDVRLLSSKSFARMTTPYVAAPMFGDGNGYGYGVAVETRDGHKVIHHTGGAVGFSSAMYIDLTAETGSFACLNSRQNQWPTEFVRYAVALAQEPKQKPATPTIPVAEQVPAGFHAARITGSYVCGPLSALVSFGGNKLQILTRRGVSALLPQAADVFSVANGAILNGVNTPGVPGPFAVVFGSGSKAESFNLGSYTFQRVEFGKAKGSTELHHISKGRFAGKYVTEGQWFEAIRIVERAGTCWLNGLKKLIAVDESRFQLEGPDSYHLDFQDEVLGAYQGIRLNGDLYVRICSGDMEAILEW